MIPTSRLPSHSSKFYLIPKVLDLSVTTYERKIDPSADIFLYHSQPNARRQVRGVLMANTLMSGPLLGDAAERWFSYERERKDLTVFYIRAPV